MGIGSFIGHFQPEEVFEKSLDALSDDKLNEIINILNNVEYPAKKRSRDELYPLFEEVLNTEENSAFDSLMSGLSILLRVTDDYDELESSIKQLCLKVDEKKKNIISTVFEKVNYWKAFYEDERLGQYKTKANSFLLGFTYLCDLRGRFKQDYDYHSTSIEEFKPELVDLIPILTMSFKVCDGVNDHKCIFQVNEEELNEIISDLLAAQKELKLIKKRI